jgi:hypothetical protein
LVVVESTTSRSFLAASMKSSRVADLDDREKLKTTKAAISRIKEVNFIVRCAITFTGAFLYRVCRCLI